MGDSLTVYHTIFSLLCQHVYGEDLRRLKVLAWAVTGLLVTASISVPDWAILIVSLAQEVISSELRLYRWLHNPLIKVNVIYSSLIRAALQEWAQQTCYLALDTSCLCGKFVLIRVALIYRGRAVPLAWRVIRSSSATVGAGDYEPVIRQAAQIVSAWRVILLADRGFADLALINLCRELGWSFRIRVKGNMRVYRTFQRSYPVSRLRPRRGEAVFIHNVFVTHRRVGPLHLALAWVKTDEGTAVWYVLSDEPTDLSTFDEYGLRFDIEESFLDDKSNGFRVEDTKLDDEASLTRLFLVLAVATVYLVSVGTEVVAQGWRRLVDAHWTRGLSYFKLGWKWLRRCLSRRSPLSRAWRLDPAPDPEPAFASRRQRFKPGLRLAIRFEC